MLSAALCPMLMAVCIMPAKLGISSTVPTVEVMGFSLAALASRGQAALSNIDMWALFQR